MAVAALEDSRKETCTTSRGSTPRGIMVQLPVDVERVNENDEDRRHGTDAKDRCSFRVGHFALWTKDICCLTNTQTDRSNVHVR